MQEPAGAERRRRSLIPVEGKRSGGIHGMTRGAKGGIGYRVGVHAAPSWPVTQASFQSYSGIYMIEFLLSGTGRHNLSTGISASAEEAVRN